MANSITRQVIHNGSRNYVVKTTIASDGATGDETDILVNATTGDMGTAASLIRLSAVTIGCSAVLEWDATADVVLAALPSDREVKLDFTHIGGIPNNAGAGKTGDVVITTTGLSTAGDTIVLVAEFKKT